VLCEKPFAVNHAEAESMFDAADRAGRTVIEAFMYRVHPATRRIVEELRRGAIGRLRLVRCSFNYCTNVIERNVRFSTDLAGGSLMDIGTYCTSLALLVADGAEPTHVHAVGHVHESGVDDMAAGTITFDGGLIASFACGMRAHADNTAYLCGEEGFIEIPYPWKPAERGAEYRVRTMPAPRTDGVSAGPTERTEICDAPAPLYGMEADAFAEAVLDGAEPFMPRHQTLSNQRILDRMRRQIGLRF
jgi:predicted dehydrogenase